MAKRAQIARTAHTKQKAKPRLVSKAHLLERHEELSALKASQSVRDRVRRHKPPVPRG